MDGGWGEWMEGGSEWMEGWSEWMEDGVNGWRVE